MTNLSHVLINYDHIHLNKKGHEVYANFMSKKIEELVTNQ